MQHGTSYEDRVPVWRSWLYAMASLAFGLLLFWGVEKLLLLGLVRHLVAIAVAVPFGLLLYGTLDDVVEDILADRRERREECSTRHTT